MHRVYYWTCPDVYE